MIKCFLAMSEQIKKYETYLKTKKLKDNSARSYLWHAQKFFSWFDKRKITEENLKKYYEYLLHSTDKISSINLHLVITNDLLGFLKKRFRFDLLSNKISQATTLTKRQLDEFLGSPEPEGRPGGPGRGKRARGDPPNRGPAPTYADTIYLRL